MAVHCTASGVLATQVGHMAKSDSCTLHQQAFASLGEGTNTNFRFAGVLYPLVNVYIAMESHQSHNPLKGKSTVMVGHFLKRYVIVYQRVEIMVHSAKSPQSLSSENVAISMFSSMPISRKSCTTHRNLKLGPMERWIIWDRSTISDGTVASNLWGTLW